jgi:hypothetical protein
LLSPEPPPSRLAALEGASFLLVALLGLGFQAWLPRVLPDEVDERGVAAVLQTEAQPGDVVLLHPWWTERARLFLPPNLPIVGYLGDETDALLESPRIWVLGEPELPRTQEATFAAAFLPARTRLGVERRFGPYRLSLYRNGRWRRVGFSAAEALKTASVAVDVPGAGPSSCVPEGLGFRCPAGVRVESSLHEVLYRPSRCLFVVPPGGKGTVELTFEDVPPTAALRLEAAIVWEHAWKHGGGLTPLHVSLADADTGRRLASVTVEPGQEGFVAAEAPGGARRLRLSVQSDNAHEREGCIQLRGLEGPPPPGAAP